MDVSWSERVGIYRILDDVLGTGIVPPGAKGAIFSIIDRLRASTLTEDLHRAEQISVDLQKLEAALQLRSEASITEARLAFRAHAAALLQSRISCRAV